MRRVKPAQLAPACRPLDDAASLLRKLEAAFAGALIPTRTKLLCALVSARGEGTDSSGEASGVAREVSSCSAIVIVVGTSIDVRDAPGAWNAAIGR